VDFNQLIKSISDTHEIFQQRAFQSVNINLTLRNWFYGLYIVEYEQNGKDRAKYGDALIKEIADKFISGSIKGLSFRNLNLFRKFYIIYPQIVQTASALFRNEIENQALPVKSDTVSQIDFMLSEANKKKTQTMSEQFVSVDILISRLSFSHFVELMKCDNELQRTFYEIESIKGTWAVRELKRQMNSLLFERTGLSKNKEKLLRIANKNKGTIKPEDVIRDPYFLEFAGLKPKDVYTESELETALLNHIQEFLLELGKGFTFEARQKRINIGGEYFKIDMVFYHRILRCHVLIELKTRDFHYSDVTQLNVYLNYYKKHEMLEDENPPIGILLCTAKNEPLVEFATEGIDNQVFISKYKVVLPSKSELKQLLKSEMKYIEK